MSFKDIKNLIKQNGNISLDKLNSTIKQKKANQETIKSAQSIFTRLDKNVDGQIDEKEWENINQEYENLDTNKDGIISEDEAKNAPENGFFKTFGSKMDEFFDFVKQSFTPNSEEQAYTENEDSNLPQPEYPNNNPDTNINNEEQAFELKFNNVTPNPKNSFNSTNLNITNKDGNFLGHASYVVNSENSSTAYGININNVDSTDPENSDNNFSLNVSAHKDIEHKTDEQTEKIKFGTTIGLENLTLNKEKQVTNNTDESYRSSEYTLNTDLKNFGNFDLKHSSASNNNGSTETNTQSIGMADDDISLVIENETSNISGNIRQKKADATYNTDQNNLNLNFNNSIQTNENSRTKSFNINTATNDLNLQTSFNSTRKSNEGDTSSINLSAGYNENISFGAEHSTTKIQNDLTITNTQSAGIENDVVTVSLGKNSTDDKGNVENKSSSTSYNSESGEVDFRYSTNNEGEQNNKTKTLDITSNTTDFDAKADFNSTKNNEDGSLSSLNLSGGIESDGSTSLGFGNSTKRNTGNGSITRSNDATVSNSTEHVTSASFTNKKGVIINDENGNSSNIEQEIMFAGSSNGDSEINYRIDQTRTITDEQEGEIEQSRSHEVGTHYNSEEGALDLHYSQTRSVNGELQSSLDINGTVSKDGGQASVRTSKLNKHGRMVRTEIAANASDEAQHLGLRFKRNINNTSSTTVEDGAKPKKSKSFYIKADFTKQQINNGNAGYDEFFDDYIDYSEAEPNKPEPNDTELDYSELNITNSDDTELYDNEFDDTNSDNTNTENTGLDNEYTDVESKIENYPEEEPDYSTYTEENNYDDNLANDYDYSNGAGNHSKTNIDVQTRYRVGNNAVSAETHNLDGGRIGYSHSFHNSDNSTNGTIAAFAEYTNENKLNTGIGASKVKRDENGRLKHAVSGSVTVNTDNGDVTATTGYAAPIRNKDGTQVGNISTYAQYNSKNNSFNLGGQMSKIIYKKSAGNNQPEIEDENEDLLDDETKFQDNTQDAEEMENIGNHEIIDNDTVEEDLNNAAQVQEGRQVAGGYHIHTEIGHNENGDTAIQYNIDAQGFANTNIGNKNATIYGRVTSTNGQLNEVDNVYGGQLNNPMQSDIRDVASGNENIGRYRETSFKGNEDSEVNNVTTVGMGAVIGNPEQVGTNYAGAANAVFEDGKMTQFTAMGRGEYVYTAGNNRQAIGAEAIYNKDTNSETTNFTADAYYDHTFNQGKTRINAGIGYAQNSYMDQTTHTVFTSFGARQQIAKNLDIYGQFEFGQTKGIGSMEDSSDNYMATRIGAQYHINSSLVVFGEYNTGHGSAMSQSRMIPQAEKDRLKAGNVTLGIGARF